MSGFYRNLNLNLICLIFLSFACYSLKAFLQKRASPLQHVPQSMKWTKKLFASAVVEKRKAWSAKKPANFLKVNVLESKEKTTSHILIDDKNKNYRDYIELKRHHLLNVDWDNTTLSLSLLHIFDPEYFYTPHYRKQHRLNIAKFLLTFYQKMDEEDLLHFLFLCRERKYNPIQLLPLKFLQEKLQRFQVNEEMLSNSLLVSAIEYLRWTTPNTSDLAEYLQFLAQKLEENKMNWDGRSLSRAFQGFRHFSSSEVTDSILSILVQRCQQNSSALTFTLDQYAQILEGIRNMPWTATTQTLIDTLIPLVHIEQSKAFNKRHQYNQNSSKRQWRAKEFTVGWYGFKKLQWTNLFTKPYFSYLLRRYREQRPLPKTTASVHPMGFWFTGNQIAMILSGIISDKAIQSPKMDILYELLQEHLEKGPSTSFNRKLLMQILSSLKPQLLQIITSSSSEEEAAAIITRYQKSLMMSTLFSIYRSTPLDQWFLSTNESSTIPQDPSLPCLILKNTLLPFHIWRRSKQWLSSFFEILYSKLKQQQFHQDPQKTRKLSKEQWKTLISLFSFRECNPLDQPLIFPILELLYAQLVSIRPSEHSDWTVEDYSLCLSQLRYILRYESPTSKQWIEFFTSLLIQQVNSSQGTLLSDRSFQKIMKGISGCSSSRPEIQVLLQVLTTSLPKTVTVTTFLMSLHALSEMSSEEVIVQRFLHALKQSVDPSLSLSNASTAVEPVGFLAAGYYGLQHMSCRHNEVEEILTILNSRWLQQPIPTSRAGAMSMITALYSMMIGIQKMRLEESKEVKKVLIILATIPSMLIYPISPSILAKIIYGLKNLSAKSYEVRHLLTVLTKQLLLLDDMKVKQLQRHHTLVLNLQKRAKNLKSSTTFFSFERERNKQWLDYVHRQGMIDLIFYPSTSDSIFSIPEIKTCLEGIQSLERYCYKEVEEFISALQVQISKIGYGNEQFFQ